ncbi:MAG TPA: hypothetical protein VFQ61_02670 [Polyangiaceae bacterium]|nr:hypothetical protein [Polyangiaceae bacterium]
MHRVFGMLVVALTWVGHFGCDGPNDLDVAHVQVTRHDCAACHLPDYAAARTPLHQDADKALYPTTCGGCHAQSHWSPASFFHPFPLEGRHARAACAQCHTGSPPRFQGTPGECFACHESDYRGSPFPGHSASPTSCGDCHTPSGWSPATGLHPEDLFPIRTGVHQFACRECHDSSRGSNGVDNTNCVGCHVGVHARSRLDPIHLSLELTDYPTGDAPPNFCLSCHPSGSR